MVITGGKKKKLKSKPKEKKQNTSEFDYWDWIIQNALVMSQIEWTNKLYETIGADKSNLIFSDIAYSLFSAGTYDMWNKKIPLAVLLEGQKHELEHVNKNTTLGTGNVTARLIALQHLNEDVNYYNKLKKVEKY